ncbi:MAG: polynucleotide adenylyltransferase PcnB [Candidatus Wallbacteria bacterium]|nr:polynucleotide adenylyltransferase PcnB [Candidatus Wallbacteria bacterium]
MEDVQEVAAGSLENFETPLLIPHDRIDPDALKVIHRLTRHGFLAYLVGGCVRDLLLSFTPKDFDVATSAWPGEVRDLFRNCRIIGRRFRLAHILFSGKFIEVSTFRGSAAEPDAAEGEDLLIREDNVFGSPEEDARRRDFTLNALFYDVENHEIIDYVGGLDDIEGRIVRCIGDPQIRFREDPVRIMRALRFATRLGFDLEPEIQTAMADVKADLTKSAPPRVHEELLKTIACGASASAIEMLHATGVLQVLMPGISEAIPDTRELLFGYLAALDRLAGGRRTISDAVLQAALLYPIYHRQTGGDTDPYLWLDGERGRSPLLMSTRKRDMERMLQMFRAQRRFVKEGRGRRFSTAAFVRKDYFEDAWALFRIGNEATGEHSDIVAEWESRLAALEGGRPHQPRPGNEGRTEGAHEPGEGDSPAAAGGAPGGEPAGGTRPASGSHGRAHGRRRRQRHRFRGRERQGPQPD